MKNTNWYTGTQFLVVALMLPTMSAYAADGDFVWAKAMGGTGFCRGSKIAIDNANNLYVTGSFSDTVDFDPGPGTHNLTSAGKDDIFVLKMDGNGALVWAKSFGGLGGDGGSGIVVDTAGDVYLTGSFTGMVDFDPNEGTFTLEAVGWRDKTDYDPDLRNFPVGLEDIFVSKLDRNGNFVWAKAIGGEDRDWSSDIAIDSNSNVYITGSFKKPTDLGPSPKRVIQTSVDFDPGPGVFKLIPTGYDNAFVLKLDSNGDFVWAKSMGGKHTDRGCGIVVNDMGNIYVVGNFSNTIDFDLDPKTANFSDAGRGDIFVLKLKSNGDFVWVKTIGGKDQDFSSCIAIDDFSNVYTAGLFSCPLSYIAGSSDVVFHYNEPVDFDPGPNVCNLQSVGCSDIFVSKLDNTGDFAWAKSMGGKRFEGISSITVDKMGNIYTTGSFEDTVDFDPGPGTFNLTSIGKKEPVIINGFEQPITGCNGIFVSKLDNTGNFVWAKSMGGTGYNGGRDIAVDSKANIYVTGEFWETVDFDPGPGITEVTAIDKSDMFILKLSGPDTTSPEISISGPSVNETALGPVTYQVAYSEADTITLSENDVTLDVTDNVTASVTVTPKGESNYELLLSSISGEGTLGFTIAPGTASDASGNLSPGASTNKPVQVTPESPKTGWPKILTYLAVETLFLACAAAIYGKYKRRA